MARVETLRVPRVIAPWLVWLAGLALLTYGFRATEFGVWAVLEIGLGGLAFGIVGLLLAIKASHVIGWLFLGLQAALGLSLLGVTGPEMIMVAAILLVFPTGRLPSSRWAVAVVGLALAAASWVASIAQLVSDDINWLVFLASVVPVMIASAIRIVLDYRRSTGELRQQLKWLAGILVVGGGVLLVSVVPLPYIDDAHDLAGVILMIGSPIAVFFAITRYRLYEIDRIISQTISYSIIVLGLGLVFAAGSIWIPQRMGMEEPLAVAASTLAVAASFNPLRRRVQNAVDRRFNRSKYDHERVADEFSASLRDGVDLEHVVQGWVGVVNSTLHPSSIGVWTKAT